MDRVIALPVPMYFVTVAAVVIACACGDDDRSSPGAEHALRDAAADGGALVVSDASAPEHADAAEDAGAGSEFAIGLSTTACKGRCPIFDLKLNQSGALELNGRGNTRQQGWGAKTVEQETAREILDAILAANYWELNDVYIEQADGCTEVEPEQTTYTWSVRTDGPTKIVIDYQGCKGVPEVEALRKIPDLLIDKLELELWLGL